MVELSDELGKLIADDMALSKKIGCKVLVNHQYPRDDLANLNIAHSARRLLTQYTITGLPVITKDAL